MPLVIPDFPKRHSDLRIDHGIKHAMVAIEKDTRRTAVYCYIRAQASKYANINSLTKEIRTIFQGSRWYNSLPHAAIFWLSSQHKHEYIQQNGYDSKIPIEDFVSLPWSNLAMYAFEGSVKQQIAKLTPGMQFNNDWVTLVRQNLSPEELHKVSCMLHPMKDNMGNAGMFVDTTLAPPTPPPWDEGIRTPPTAPPPQPSTLRPSQLTETFLNSYRPADLFVNQAMRSIFADTSAAVRPIVLDTDSSDR